jgi:hypothetical protein
MSGKESDHQDLRYHPLDEFEAALAALRPRVDPSPSRAEFIPFQCGVGVNSLTCESPTGHEFVCLHCGIDAPRIIPRRRWAWPAALTAMTSVAAVLLAWVVVDRTARIAERENKSVGPSVAALVANEPDLKPKRIDFGRETDVPRRLALHSSGERWILSAADVELHDDLLASRDGFKSDATASFPDVENADARLSNGALTRRLLGEYGAAGRTAE